MNTDVEAKLQDFAFSTKLSPDPQAGDGFSSQNSHDNGFHSHVEEGNDEFQEFRQKMQDFWDDTVPVDPTGKRVLAATLCLLSVKGQATLKDISAVSEVGDSACRKRLTELIELHFLGYQAGAGRLPALYLPPKEPSKRVRQSDFEVLLSNIETQETSIREQIEKLQSELQNLQEERETAEAALLLSQKYANVRK